MTFRILILLIFYPNLFVFSQWENLNTGLSDDARVLYFDSLSNNLFVGGNFTFADNIFVNGIAKWNGLTWDSLNSHFLYGAPVYALTKYQGLFYVSSVFYYHPPDYDNWLARWNGSAWDTSLGNINGAIRTFKQFNSDLYFGGSFTSVVGINTNMVAKFDGTYFTGFNLPSTGGGFAVDAIEFYQGNMYVGGNFFDTITQINDLEMWDGNAFRAVNGLNLSFGGTSVNSMAVYKNELYIGGWFKKASGDPGNFIMRYDGTQFKEVGGGLDGVVYTMKVYKDELYVGGLFSTAGNIHADCLAKWDGTNWSCLCPSIIDNGVLDLTFHNDELYVAGGFYTINGDTMMNIAKYNLSTGIHEVFDNSEITICPNPAKKYLNINSSKNIKEIKLVDVSGKELNKYTECRQIDVSSLNNGLYFLKILTDCGHQSAKFMKQ